MQFLVTCAEALALAKTRVPAATHRLCGAPVLWWPCGLRARIPILQMRKQAACTEGGHTLELGG